jgi:hypothetical protein
LPHPVVLLDPNEIHYVTSDLDYANAPVHTAIDHAATIHHDIVHLRVGDSHNTIHNDDLIQQLVDNDVVGRASGHDYYHHDNVAIHDYFRAYHNSVRHVHEMQTAVGNIDSRSHPDYDFDSYSHLANVYDYDFYFYYDYSHDYGFYSNSLPEIYSYSANRNDFYFGQKPLSSHDLVRKMIYTLFLYTSAHMSGP